MMNNKQQNAASFFREVAKLKNLQPKNNGYISIITVLLGVAAVATTIAYFVIRVYNDHQHREKWKDYNDCGLA